MAGRQEGSKEGRKERSKEGGRMEGRREWSKGGREEGKKNKRGVSSLLTYMVVSMSSEYVTSSSKG